MNIIFPTISVVLFILFILLLRKKIDLFGIYVFLMIFHTVKFNIGLNLFIYQIIMFVLIIVTIIKFLLHEKVNIFQVHNAYLSLFVVYSLIITLLFAIITDVHNLHANFFRAEGRFIGQIILFILSFSIIPIAFNYIKKIGDIYKYSKIFLLSLIFLTALGWIQWLIYKNTGQDIFPLRLNSDGLDISGILHFGGETLFRMSSLGGEPKQFSISLIIGFFLIHISNRFNVSYFMYDVFIKYLFLFTAFATLSTSAYAIFIILLTTYYLINIFIFHSNLLNLHKKKFIYAIITISLLTIYVIYNFNYIFEMFTMRVLDRNIVGEDFDYVVQQFLLNNKIYLLFGTGLGNVHNYAYPYIYEEVAFYMTNAIFSAKSGYLKIISELGILGFFLFTAYNIYVLRGLKFNFNNENKILFMFLLILIIAYFSRISAFTVYLTFFAISNSYIYTLRNKLS